MIKFLDAHVTCTTVFGTSSFFKFTRPTFIFWNVEYIVKLESLKCQLFWSVCDVTGVNLTCLVVAVIACQHKCCASVFVVCGDVRSRYVAESIFHIHKKSSNCTYQVNYLNYGVLFIENISNYPFNLLNEPFTAESSHDWFQEVRQLNQAKVFYFWQNATFVTIDTYKQVQYSDDSE